MRNFCIILICFVSLCLAVARASNVTETKEESENGIASGDMNGMNGTWRQFPNLPNLPICQTQSPCSVVHGACTCGGYDPGYCRLFCQFWWSGSTNNNLQYGYTCRGCQCNCINPHYVG